MRFHKLIVWVSVLAWALVVPASAEVKVASIFSDDMVLQQKAGIPVWGTASPGEQVTVTLEADEATTKADKDGNWMVRLQPRDAGGPFTLIVRGENIVALTNVLVGEVWVCSGQSNMEWNLISARDGEQEVAAATDKLIRGVIVPKAVTSGPQKEFAGSWTVCSPNTAGSYSAVAYFFARHLRQTLNVPVGLVLTYWGGTPAESWTEASFLENEPDFEPLVKRWEDQIAAYPKQLDDFQKAFADWKRATLKAETDGTPFTDPPAIPGDIRRNPNRPSGLYNAMIAPVVPFAIKGAIWYQGESNAGRAYQYRKLHPAMIQSWRKAWGQGDFPFLFVQLANFTDTFPEPRENEWAELREAQTMTLSAIPNTGMAVTIDIGEAKDIHPRNKQDVGKRLGLQAEKVAYGRDVAASGPMYDSMSVEDNKIRVKFKFAEGLTAQGGGDLKGFAIAGEDKKFVWANAQIDGDSVVVSADAVAKPVAVRYAWDINPVCNLFNGVGLPASPFRTDEWPGMTINAK